MPSVVPHGHLPPFVTPSPALPGASFPPSSTASEAASPCQTRGSERGRQKERKGGRNGEGEKERERAIP